MFRYVLIGGHAHISTTYTLEDRVGSRVSYTKWTCNGHIIMSRYVLISGHAHISITYPLEDRARSQVSETKWTCDMSGRFYALGMYDF